MTNNIVFHIFCFKRFNFNELQILMITWRSFRNRLDFLVSDASGDFEIVADFVIFDSLQKVDVIGFDDLDLFQPVVVVDQLGGQVAQEDRQKEELEAGGRNLTNRLVAAEQVQHGDQSEDKPKN
jgi:hypothetical protein